VKDPAKLDLADKLDLMRTLVRLEQRSEGRHKIADLDEAITLDHVKRVQEGLPTGVNFSDVTKAIVSGLTQALPAADETE
jgi:hypothetical protein